MSEIQSKENVTNMEKKDVEFAEVTEQEVRQVVRQESELPIGFRQWVVHS